jgi:hypothetical protein
VPMIKLNILCVDSKREVEGNISSFIKNIHEAEFHVMSLVLLNLHKQKTELGSGIGVFIIRSGR